MHTQYIDNKSGRNPENDTYNARSQRASRREVSPTPNELDGVETLGPRSEVEGNLQIYLPGPAIFKQGCFYRFNIYVSASAFCSLVSPVPALDTIK